MISGSREGLKGATWVVLMIIVHELDSRIVVYIKRTCITSCRSTQHSFPTRCWRYLMPSSKPNQQRLNLLKDGNECDCADMILTCASDARSCTRKSLPRSTSSSVGRSLQGHRAAKWRRPEGCIVAFINM